MASSDIYPDYERRNMTGASIRALPGIATLTGYAALFNSLSADLGGFRERVLPGAFTESIGSDDVRVLWNHNPDMVLGRTKNKTLRFTEDAVGLRFEMDLNPADVDARRALAKVNRGDVDQMSFGFRARKDRWLTESGSKVRELVKVRLFDVSPVTFPAYAETNVSVALRSMRQAKQTLAKAETRQRLEKAEREVARDTLAMRVRGLVRYLPWFPPARVLANTVAELVSADIGIPTAEISFASEHEAGCLNGWTYPDRRPMKIFLRSGLCGHLTASVVAHELKHLDNNMKYGSLECSTDEDEAARYETRFTKRFLSGVTCHGCNAVL